MEGIRILHDEFTATHQPESGANLIPELGLDLIKVHGELPVGAQHLPRQAGDHLFMGGSKAKLATLTVFQVEHDSFPCGVALPPPTALPEFRGVQLGQECFQGTGAIHFFADDRGDALQHLPHHRQIGIDP